MQQAHCSQVSNRCHSMSVQYLWLHIKNLKTAMWTEKSNILVLRSQIKMCLFACSLGFTEIKNCKTVSKSHYLGRKRTVTWSFWKVWDQTNTNESTLPVSGLVFILWTLTRIPTNVRNSWRSICFNQECSLKTNGAPSNRGPHRKIGFLWVVFAHLHLEHFMSEHTKGCVLYLNEWFTYVSSWFYYNNGYECI